MSKIQQFKEGFSLTSKEQEIIHRNEEGEKAGYFRIGQRNRQEKMPSLIERFRRGLDNALEHES